MKRVALVAYWYPPHNVIGALRSSKLAKFLPDFGWAAHVITVDPRHPRHLAFPLAEEALAAGAVHRTRDLSLHAWLALGLSRLQDTRDLETMAFDSARAKKRAWLGAMQWAYLQMVAFPDEAWPWRFEYGRARQAARGARVDAVISTSPPATAHLMAARLARDLEVPWIADFRDAWTQRVTRRRIPPLGGLERRLERRTIASAAELVTVSEPLARDLANLHAKRVTVIPNGFDPADLPAPDITRLPLDPTGFTIVHTGTLTHDTRDPSAFLSALGEALGEQGLPPEATTAWFVGRNLDVARRALASAPHLAGHVRLSAAVSREVALATQRAATVLLIVESPEPEHVGVVTGKIFEYLAAERPILAFGPPGGSVDVLLRETGGGTLATSAADAVPALLDWAREFRATGTVRWRGDRAAVLRYDRRALAGRWADALDRVVAAHQPRTPRAAGAQSSPHAHGR